MDHIPFLDLTPCGYLAYELNNACDYVLNSGRYIGGCEVQAFEEEWAAYCGARYCVGVGNGHDALMLACESFGLDCIVRRKAFVPWKTCLPTWSAVRNANVRPVPIIRRKIDLAIAVHIYGQITLPEVYVDVPLIEDCAQAHGAMLNGTKAGKFGKVAAWSFYPTKNLGALGDAGAVTTDDEEIACFVRSRSNYGTRDNTGVNSRLDPLQAAFLRVKLPYLDEWNGRREENAFAYYESISSCNIDMPPWGYDNKPSWHIFAIETNDRDDLAAYLRNNGVETMVHYPHPPYPSHYYIPEAEAWTRRTLSLPVAPHVTPEQCTQIGELINQWINSRQS